MMSSTYSIHYAPPNTAHSGNEYHAPYYIVTLVFHDQSVNITENIRKLNTKIINLNLPDHPIHTAPLIRREYEYRGLSLHERKCIFNALFNFARTVDIAYHPLIIEKKQLVDEIDLNIRITKQLSNFLFTHLEYFMRFDHIMIYYDFGQMELTKILVSVFNTVLSNVDFKRVVPTEYRLFQAADMLCTMELLDLKAERKMLSNSELSFFKSARDLNKSYLKALHGKKFK